MDALLSIYLQTGSKYKNLILNALLNKSGLVEANSFAVDFNSSSIERKFMNSNSFMDISCGFGFFIVNGISFVEFSLKPSKINSFNSLSVPVETSSVKSLELDF